MISGLYLTAFLKKKNLSPIFHMDFCGMRVNRYLSLPVLEALTLNSLKRNYSVLLPRCKAPS